MRDLYVTRPRPSHAGWLALASSLCLSLVLACGMARADDEADADEPAIEGQADAPAWRKGQVVRVLPPDATSLSYAGLPYFYGAGVWFRPHRGGRYIVAVPPAGLVVPSLPAGAQSFWVGPDLYFHAHGVTYVGDIAGGYRVVSVMPTLNLSGASEQDGEDAPAPAARKPRTSRHADGLYVYPRKGQRQSRLVADRKACNAWAREESGHDPAATEDTDADAYAEFQRAVSVCLEARGYSVR